MTAKTSDPGKAKEWRSRQSRTSYVMTVLEHLLLDFESLGRLEGASPHMQALMDLLASRQSDLKSRQSRSTARTRRNIDAAE